MAFMRNECGLIHVILLRLGFLAVHVPKIVVVIRAIINDSVTFSLECPESIENPFRIGVADFYFLRWAADFTRCHALKSAV